MRPGRSMGTSTSDGSRAYSASANDEIVVPEVVAAFLVRQRAAEILEVIPPPDGEPEEASGV